jgi:hypothetical protein
MYITYLNRYTSLIKKKAQDNEKIYQDYPDC